MRKNVRGNVDNKQYDEVTKFEDLKKYHFKFDFYSILKV